MQIQRIQNSSYNPNFQKLVVIDELAQKCLRRDLGTAEYDEFLRMIDNINSRTNNKNIINIRKIPNNYYGEIFKNGIAHLKVYERSKRFYESMPTFVRKLVSKSQEI